MRAVDPLDSRLIDELEICLVNQRSGIECVTIALAGKLVVRDVTQLVVDDREEPIRGFGAPGAPREQEPGNCVIVQVWLCGVIQDSPPAQGSGFSHNVKLGARPWAAIPMLKQSSVAMVARYYARWRGKSGHLL